MKRFFMPALVAVALVAAPTRAYCSEAPDTLALSLREAIDMAIDVLKEKMTEE